MKSLWNAVTSVGYQTTKIVSDGKTYKGPKPQ